MLTFRQKVYLPIHISVVSLLQSADMRLVLTWKPNHFDLDSEVKLFDHKENVFCRIYYADPTACVDNLGETLVHLDVDETNVRKSFFQYFLIPID